VQAKFPVSGATGATGSMRSTGQNKAVRHAKAAQSTTNSGRQQMSAIPEPTDSNSVAHPLDHVIWRALTSRNRNLAEGDGLALRYPAPIAPFAATIDLTTASFQSLAPSCRRVIG
jgi:hypothetical protein